MAEKGGKRSFAAPSLKARIGAKQEELGARTLLGAAFENSFFNPLVGCTSLGAIFHVGLIKFHERFITLSELAKSRMQHANAVRVLLQQEGVSEFSDGGQRYGVIYDRMAEEHML